MDKKEIDCVVQCAMRANHWELKSLLQLPQSYVRDISVTPAYVPSVIRRSDSSYIISGYIGLIDQLFERSWLALRKGASTATKGPNSFCLARHVANFDPLRRLCYLDAADYQNQVAGFCTALVGILEQLPHDEAALKIGLETEKLGSYPLEKFAVYGQDDKIGAMRRFLRADPRPH